LKLNEAGIERNTKRIDNTSLLSLVSLPIDTAALLQFPVNESANSGLHMMFDCSDHLSDVDSGGFSSFLLQVLTSFSTKKKKTY